MVEIDYTNEVLMNHYKKQEIKKAKERLAQKKTKAEILKLADERFITADEIKEALGFEFIEDPEPVKEQEHVVDEVDYVIEDEDNQEVAKYEKEENITATLIEDSKLEDYPNQPFKLYDKEKRNEMIESIRINGITQPLIVRPIDNGKYQILAGHNRRSCARELGITKYPCIIKKGTLAHELYGTEEISERHRHRYEYNNDYREKFEKAGLKISGTSPDGLLVEMIELEKHPYFIAGQFHPELKSRPNKPSPLFVGLIQACLKN